MLYMAYEGEAISRWSVRERRVSRLYPKVLLAGEAERARIRVATLLGMGDVLVSRGRRKIMCGTPSEKR